LANPGRAAKAASNSSPHENTDTGAFFQRLDKGGGVFFSKAKRNGFFEILLNAVQRRNGRTNTFTKLLNKACVPQYELLARSWSRNRALKYCFVRRQRTGTKDAEDLTQGFFALLLERKDRNERKAGIFYEFRIAY
jgi:hypothetical protein